MVLFVLIAANLSFGQKYRYNYTQKNVKKLETITEANEGKIYIKSEFNDKDDIHVFLINRTDSLLRPYLGHNQSIEFVKEALDEDGNWKLIDHFEKPRGYFVCGTGILHLKLDSNHYAWQKIYKSEYSGNYTTKVRFSFRLNDSLTIVSRPMHAKIDRNLFLPFHARRLLQLDSLLNDVKISKTHTEKLLRLKLRTYEKYANASRTVAIANEIVKTYPLWIEGKDRLAHYLLKYLGKNRKYLSKPEITLILSKAMDLWDQIPKEQKKIYHQAPVYIRKYDKLLLTKTEWLKSETNHYEQIGEDYFAPLSILNGELVKIKFKTGP